MVLSMTVLVTRVGRASSSQLSVDHDMIPAFSRWGLKGRVDPVGLMFSNENTKPHQVKHCQKQVVAIYQSPKQHLSS